MSLVAGVAERSKQNIFCAQLDTPLIKPTGLRNVWLSHRRYMAAELLISVCAERQTSTR